MIRLNLKTAVRFAIVAVVVKVTMGIVYVYRDYFPPNFRAPFLVGRESYFFGPYEWAFYGHILAGPPLLIMGMFLMSERVRQRLPRLHRWMGRLQVGLILTMLVPSGLWMSAYTATGWIAGTSFALLAAMTGWTTLMGWQSILRRDLERHRRWMNRSYVLLCSAIVLRLMGGIAELWEWEESYPFAAWGCWVIPLVLLEIWLGAQDRRRSLSDPTR